MSVESVMPSNHLILCHPLLLLPSSFPSIRVFSNESTLPIRWPKYWSFSFSISPSNKYSGLISFRIDWFDLLAVQGTLKSLLQNHCLKASIHWHSAFFMVQLSHPYMTAGKTIVLAIWTFVCIYIIKDIDILKPWCSLKLWDKEILHVLILFLWKQVGDFFLHKNEWQGRVCYENSVILILSLDSTC